MAETTKNILKQILLLWRKLNEQLSGKPPATVEKSRDTKEEAMQKTQETLPKSAPEQFGLLPRTIDEIEDTATQERLKLLATLQEQWLNEHNDTKTKERKTRKDKGVKRGPLPDTSKRVDEMVEHLNNWKQKSTYHMLLFIMYDIEDNKIRKQVADYLQAKGLQRVQKSVFFGEINRKYQEEIHDVLVEIRNSYENEDSLLIVPIAEDEFRKLQMIGKEVNFSLDLMRGNTVFF